MYIYSLQNLQKKKKKRRHVLHLCTAPKGKKQMAAPQRDRCSGFWVQQFLRVQRERWPGYEKVGVAHRPQKGEIYIHSGRLTARTYETPTKRKENDLNQSSRELWEHVYLQGCKECQHSESTTPISLEQNKKTFQSFRFPPKKNDDVSRFRLRPVPHRPLPCVPFSNG